nr:MAG TPA: hypothetical protein [Caudoviricetes sp.]
MIEIWSLSSLLTLLSLLASPCSTDHLDTPVHLNQPD